MIFAASVLQRSQSAPPSPNGMKPAWHLRIPVGARAPKRCNTGARDQKGASRPPSSRSPRVIAGRLWEWDFSTVPDAMRSAAVDHAGLLRETREERLVQICRDAAARLYLGLLKSKFLRR